MPEELEPRLHFAEWEQNLLTRNKTLELTLKIVLVTSTLDLAGETLMMKHVESSTCVAYARSKYPNINC